MFAQPLADRERSPPTAMTVQQGKGFIGRGLKSRPLRHPSLAP
jgi:hypothetical protein